VDQIFAFSVLQDLLRPHAKLPGGFILLGLETSELGFGLFDPALAGFFWVFA
jgi:hypothetical protein